METAVLTSRARALIGRSREADSSKVRGRIAGWARQRPDIRVEMEQCDSTTTLKVRRAAPGVVKSKAPVELTSVQEREIVALTNALAHEFALHVEPTDIPCHLGYAWKGYTLTLLQ